MPGARSHHQGWPVRMTAQSESELRHAAEVIATLPKGNWDIEVVRRREKRSTEQNRLLWALYTAIAEETGHTPEEIHEACKSILLPPEIIKVGKREVTVSGSTARRDVAEFSDYIEKVRALAQNELGVVV